MGTTTQRRSLLLGGAMVVAMVLSTGCGRLHFGVVADAAGDAASADDAADASAPSQFCDLSGSGHTFCADFEHSPDVASGWTATQTSFYGQYALDTIGRDSAHSIVLSVAPHADQTMNVPTFGVRFAPASGTTHLMMRAQVELPAQPDYGCVEASPMLGLSAANGDSTNDDFYLCDDHASFNEEYCPAGCGETGPIMLQDTQTTVPFSAGAWHELAIDLDIVAQHVQVSVDGTVVVDRATSYPVSCSGACDAWAGAWEDLPTSTGALVRIDDVLIDTN